MGRSVNKVIMVGNLGRDAETKFTSAGTEVTTFSIATSWRKKGADGQYVEETDWHNMVLWDSEKVAAYLLKGKQVYVEGRLKTRTYEKDGEKRYSTEVNVHEVILLGGRESDGGQAPVSRPRPQAEHRQTTVMPQQQQQAIPADDDIPF